MYLGRSSKLPYKTASYPFPRAAEGETAPLLGIAASHLFELDAIAAAFVGGVSAAGGVGKVVGAILGAFVMASLTNGMNLLGWDISIQYIVRALVLTGAVIFDVATRNRGK